MFQVKKQLTNTRPPSSEEPELITTPTKGNLRLTSAAAELLGVAPEDYVAIVEAEVEEQDYFFIHKGMKDDGKGNQVGSKLASPTSKVGGSLIFSSSYTWQTLGGNDETNKIFRVLSAEEAQEELGLDEVPDFTEGKTTYFMLKFEKEVEKQERNYEKEEEEA